MAGPNLELFKFSLYLFFPLAIMIHYGDPQWYHDNVLPFREKFWPADDSHYKPPRNREDLRSALEEFRRQRLEGKLDENSTKEILSNYSNRTSPSTSSSQQLPSLPNLRPNGTLGSFGTSINTGIRQPGSSTWRERWIEAQKGRVV